MNSNGGREEWINFTLATGRDVPHLNRQECPPSLRGRKSHPGNRGVANTCHDTVGLADSDEAELIEVRGEKARLTLGVVFFHPCCGLVWELCQTSHKGSMSESPRDSGSSLMNGVYSS